MPLFKLLSLRFHSVLGRSWGLDGSGARLALSRHPVAPRWNVRTQDEPPIETACLETSVDLGNLIEGDSGEKERADSARCQQAEEQLKVVLEPGGMSCPHRIDRVYAHSLAAR